MLGKLVVDTSTLVSLERTGLEEKLAEINFKILIPPTVAEELDHEKWEDLTDLRPLRGRSLRKVEELMEVAGIGRGEAECLVLAKREGLDFVVSDDRKLIRQRFLLRDKYLRDIKILGFSFLLHLFERSSLIKDVWSAFDDLIAANDWERSEVYVANYTFLKEMGYKI